MKRVPKIRVDDLVLGNFHQFIVFSICVHGLIWVEQFFILPIEQFPYGLILIDELYFNLLFFQAFELESYISK